MLRKMKPIASAGCLIIGDEVLNGKILDTNAHAFAQFCFNRLSIPLKKTIVCGDDSQDIINSLNILKQDNCDFIVTSGGIGPTHDDITYEAIAAYRHLPCELHQHTVERMNRLRGDYLNGLTATQRHSFYKMATFPADASAIEHIYVADDLWVPVLGIDQRIYVLPGVPQLFKRLLEGLEPHIRPRIGDNKLKRFYVKTKSNESELAPFLTQLQESCDKKYGKDVVKLGSYPHFSWRINTISIIGTSAVSAEDLHEIVDDVVRNIGGDAIEIDQVEENNMTVNDPPTNENL